MIKSLKYGYDYLLNDVNIRIFIYRSFDEVDDLPIERTIELWYDDECFIDQSKLNAISLMMIRTKKMMHSFSNMCQEELLND